MTKLWPNSNWKRHHYMTFEEKKSHSLLQNIIVIFHSLFVEYMKLIVLHNFPRGLDGPVVMVIDH
jgi:hypothetical protein